MARYTQLDKSSFGGQNSENEKISLAIDDMLSRKAGDEPNAMETDLDMNSNRILNLPEPVADQEPVRKADFDALEAQLESEVDAAVADANSATNTALNAANTANASAANADEKAAEAEEAILALQVVTIGDFATGFIITARNQVALYDDGVAPTYYRWDGALPKTVSAGSTPATTGGISAGAWVDVGQASLRSDLAEVGSTVSIGGKSAGDVGKDLFGRVRLLQGSATNLLIQDESTNQATRVHIEPNGYVDNGTTSKLDFMFDPYEIDSANYRILNFYTVTGDPFNTGEGAICAINAKGTGNTWGLWPSIQFGFQDLGTNSVCAKMWHGDHTQPEHFTPNKGPWREGKSFTAGDYATNNNDIFRAATSGVAGSTPPTHTSGTVSDGSINWEFIYSPDFNTVRATFIFGDRSDMPVLGYPSVRMQILKDSLTGWGASNIYTDVDGVEIARLRGFSTSGGVNRWLHLETSGGGYVRYSQDSNYYQSIGLAKCHAFAIFNSGETSVSVAGQQAIEFANAAPTTVTNLTGGSSGQEIKIVSTNGNTTLAYTGTTSGGVIRNSTAGNILLSPDKVYTAVLDKTGGYWRLSE